MENINKLYIAGLEILGDGVRVFNPQSKKFLVKSGLIQVNGTSGSGKSTLFEILKLAVEGKGALRDTNLIKGEGEEVDIRVPIAKFNNSESLFYIRAVMKKEGDIRYTFQIEKDGKFRNTETPLEGMDKLTVPKLQQMMNTTLTYGIDSFLSEDYLEVRKFIYDTFSDELARLNLLVDKSSPDYAESINGRIDLAIADRDEITREQSKLGAFAVNLDGIVKPMLVDMATFDERSKNLTEEAANIRAEHKVQKESKEQRIKNVMSEAESIKTNSALVKRDIADFNDKLQKDEDFSLVELSAKFSEMNQAKLKWMEVDKVFGLTDGCRDAVMQVEKIMDEVHTQIGQAIDNRPAINLCPENGEPLPVELKGSKAEDYCNTLQKYREDYKELSKQLEAIKAEEFAEEPDTTAVDAKVAELNLEIEAAKERNLLVRKFEVMEAHKRADEAVKELYLERNRLFMQINCGVKGLSILLLDNEGKRLGFHYNGQSDKEYFHNESLEPRPLTSYSKSQKIYIAAMLQCYLMSKKAFPLNVLCVDDTGIDKKVRDLYNTFAKKFGLMIFITSTNDRTESDLSPNEILIHDGEILIKE